MRKIAVTDLKEATKTPDIVSMLEWRYATKQFDPERKIESSTWDKLEKALVLSPSSYGLQPWNFVVVTDQSIKEKLANNSFQQPQPRDCSHLVVISRLESIDETYVENYLELISETRGIPKDKLADYKNMMLGFIKQSQPGRDCQLDGQTVLYHPWKYSHHCRGTSGGRLPHGRF